MRCSSRARPRSTSSTSRWRPSRRATRSCAARWPSWSRHSASSARPPASWGWCRRGIRCGCRPTSRRPPTTSPRTSPPNRPTRAPPGSSPTWSRPVEPCRSPTQRVVRAAISDRAGQARQSRAAPAPARRSPLPVAEPAGRPGAAVRRRGAAPRLRADAGGAAVRRLRRGAADRAHRPAGGAGHDLRPQRQGPGAVDAGQQHRRRPQRGHRPAVGGLARGVLGSVDPDNVGVSGLEQRYDDQLAGDPGEYMVERDLDGRTIPGGRHLIDPAEPGDDIVLTIDRSLQYATEGILAEQVRTVGAKAGWAIVSDPRTGEILALANVETDPKTHEVGNTGNNRAVTEMYEPGSVNKVITMAAALEEGVVTPETVLQVPDTLQVAEHTYGDAHSLPSEMTASDVLAQSSNIGTIKIAQRLGTERVDDYLRRFGFGQETALGLPHEARGLLVDPDNWSGTSIGSIPIGQGISVTAMQMLLTYNTIANDGVYVPPTLLEATFDAEGERHEVAAGEGRRVVSPTPAAQVRKMLAEAVAAGTGEAAAIDGYETAGKTGTARKPQPGGGYRDEQGNYHHVATFAGFIPADDPQVSIIVVIDEPTTSPYAGDVAAPAFANIGRQALRTLGIAPPAAIDAVGPRLEEPKVRAQPAAPPTTATTVPTTTTTVPGATTTTAPGTSPTTTLATTTLATTTTSAPARGG